jgi:hypothetical protein
MNYLEMIRELEKQKAKKHIAPFSVGTMVGWQRRRKGRMEAIVVGNSNDGWLIVRTTREPEEFVFLRATKRLRILNGYERASLLQKGGETYGKEFRTRS